jgi:hypothetical protein
MTSAASDRGRRRGAGGVETGLGRDGEDGAGPGRRRQGRTDDGDDDAGPGGRRRGRAGDGTESGGRARGVASGAKAVGRWIEKNVSK